MQRIKCYSCGEDFAQIALHWNGQRCGWPHFSNEQIELMKGLLLGDADIKSGVNGSIFRLRMTNKDFLDWVSMRLYPLSRGVFLSEDSEKQKKSAIRGGLKGVSEQSEFKDLYGLRTVTHPQINKLNEWYSSGEKRYPNNITEKMFLMWYVTDGWKNNNSIRIRCISQSDKGEEIISLIETLGFVEGVTFNTDKGIIRINSSDSKKFWQITEAPPGFDYKWP